MKRHILTAVALIAAFAFVALPASAVASYRVHGTEYGIKAIASNDTSPAFARNVVRAVVAGFRGVGRTGVPFTAYVFSLVTNHIYYVRFYLASNGSYWPVTAWTVTHSWVTVYYGN